MRNRRCICIAYPPRRAVTRARVLATCTNARSNSRDLRSQLLLLEGRKVRSANGEALRDDHTYAFDCRALPRFDIPPCTGYLRMMRRPMGCHGRRAARDLPISRTLLVARLWNKWRARPRECFVKQVAHVSLSRREVVTNETQLLAATISELRFLRELFQVEVGDQFAGSIVIRIELFPERFGFHLLPSFVERIEGRLAGALRVVVLAGAVFTQFILLWAPTRLGQGAPSSLFVFSSVGRAHRGRRGFPVSAKESLHLPPSRTVGIVRAVESSERERERERERWPNSRWQAQLGISVACSSRGRRSGESREPSWQALGLPFDAQPRAATRLQRLCSAPRPRE